MTADVEVRKVVRMITDEELKGKITQLMAMAGADGESYCEWTINQIIYGLREAIAGARQENVTTAVEALIEEGVVKHIVDHDRGRPQFVLVKKLPVPEPLNKSPVVISVDPGAGKAGHGKENLESAFMNKMVIDSITGRLDNLEEVMSDLNKIVGGIKSDLIADLRMELGQRIGKTEIKVEGMGGTLDMILKAIEKSLEETTDDDSVQIIEQNPKEDQLNILMKHWDAIAAQLTDSTPRSMGELGICEGKAQAFRSCSEDLRHVLCGTKVFVATGR